MGLDSVATVGVDKAVSTPVVALIAYMDTVLKDKTGALSLTEPAAAGVCVLGSVVASEPPPPPPQLANKVIKDKDKTNFAKNVFV
jgi:hypothetical protein